MPTLYVENVPNELYEALRKRAREQGPPSLPKSFLCPQIISRQPRSLLAVGSS